MGFPEFPIKFPGSPWDFPRDLPRNPRGIFRSFVGNSPEHPREFLGIYPSISLGISQESLHSPRANHAEPWQVVWGSHGKLCKVLGGSLADPCGPSPTTTLANLAECSANLGQDFGPWEHSWANDLANLGKSHADFLGESRATPGHALGNVLNSSWGVLAKPSSLTHTRGLAAREFV